MMGSDPISETVTESYSMDNKVGELLNRSTKSEVAYELWRPFFAFWAAKTYFSGKSKWGPIEYSC
jgi:hypothetical protein